ncbi:MAG: hypothetical protein IMX02_08785 [Limnochordaceae bacterium]|nr:hypothetical protein [Limnochordaceae bacterium]
MVYQRNDMVEEELIAFVQAVREDRPTAVGGREAVAALQVAMAVLESGQTGRTVMFDEMTLPARSAK